MVSKRLIIRHPLLTIVILVIVLISCNMLTVRSTEVMPEKTRQVNPLQKQVVVLQEDVPLRSGPGELYSIIQRAQKGDIINILGETADRSWLLVDFTQPGNPHLKIFGSIQSLLLT